MNKFNFVNILFNLLFVGANSFVLNNLSPNATNLFFKKWANPDLFFIYFRSFQTNIITIFITNICEKCPSSIQFQDSNPQPSERESLPISTRPGLPPYLSSCLALFNPSSQVKLLGLETLSVPMKISFQDFFKWAIHSLFFIYFQSFQTNFITIFITNICKKMSIL